MSSISLTFVLFVFIRIGWVGLYSELALGSGFSVAITVRDEIASGDFV
jgi:hypothetical protein